MKLTILVFMIGIALAFAVQTNRMKIDFDFNTEEDDNTQLMDDNSESSIYDELDDLLVLGDEESGTNENEVNHGRHGPKCDDEKCAKQCSQRHMKGRCQRGKCKCCRH